MSALSHLGDALHALGEETQALQSHEQALKTAREIGDLWQAGMCLNNMGTEYYVLGQVGLAAKYHQEALEIAQHIEDIQGQSYRLLGLSRALLARGCQSEARDCLTKALSLEIPETGFRAALALAIVLLLQKDR